MLYYFPFLRACLLGLEGPRYFASLALACGVMTSVSLLELLQPLQHGSTREVRAVSVLWAMAGAAAYALLRKLLPEEQSDSTAREEKRLSDEEDVRVGAFNVYRARQWRLGVLMMATLTLHNLPEGMAVVVSTMASPRAGFVVMCAIAMHNIPEGLAIAIPAYAATGNRWNAMGMALASGMSEPLGAGITALLLRPFLTTGVVDNANCCVGGVMLAVSALELWPESRRRNDFSCSLLGFSCGWLVMFCTVHAVR